MWTAATPAQAHPYLADKGVQPHGLRQDEAGRLMVPVQDADGRMWSLQRIGRDGFKQFQEGGRVEGGHFAIGDVQKQGPLLIAEGFATAATLHEMTEMPVIVAFNAGNFLPWRRLIGGSTRIARSTSPAMTTGTARRNGTGRGGRRSMSAG